MGQATEFLSVGIAMLMQYLPKVVLAIITLLVGLWIIKVVLKGLEKALLAREMDISLQKFLGSLLGILLKLILGISVIGILGVSTTSF